MKNFQLSVLKLFAALALMASFSAAQAIIVQQNHYNVTNIPIIGVAVEFGAGPSPQQGHFANFIFPNETYPAFAGDNRLHGQFYAKLVNATETPGPKPWVSGNTLVPDNSIFFPGIAYSEDNFGCDSSADISPNSNCAFDLENTGEFVPQPISSTINVYVMYYDSSLNQWHYDFISGVPWNGFVRFDWTRVTSWRPVASSPITGNRPNMYFPGLSSPRMLYFP